MLRQLRRISTLLVALAVLPSASNAATRIEAAVYNELSASADGRTYVFILLQAANDVPRMSLGQAQARIVEAQTDVLAALPGKDFEPRYLYENVAAMTGFVTANGLSILAGRNDVIAVGPDQRIHKSLTSSVANIRANAVQAIGITGRGITVAVMDTGIDTDHPDLADNIAPGAYTFLDFGGTQVPGAEDDDGHGTAAAGVITSRGVVAPVGVAPDADILAIKVLDSNGGGYVSDWIAGIDYVVANAGNYDNLAAISLSLGSNQLYASCPCDNANTTNQAAAAAVAAAKAAGIITIAASGNDGNTNAMSSPACLTDVVAVAATYDGAYGSANWSGCSDAGIVEDQITCFTNRGACNDVAAPGAFLTTPGIGGGTTGYGGTSGATPHVAGVVALMEQLADSLSITLSIDQIEQTLRTTGHATYDPAGTTPNPKRVDAFLAVGSLEQGPPPTASSIAPGSGFVDTSADVLITGSNFTEWTDADLGAGIITLDIVPLSADSLLVTVVIDDAAAPGFRDVTVRDAFSSSTLSNAFEVRPTTRHYVSASGAAVYPYHTPANAAVSIADVMTAVITGDSVLVDTTTIAGPGFSVLKGVTLYGGYSDGFTSRNHRTRLDLNGNILISSGGNTAGLDGFIIENGTGATSLSPVNGKYGGGMWIVNCSAIVNNCEIRNNAATNVAGGFGGGGGIFAFGADVTITNNHIHDNSATRGGGIYFYNSTGTVAGNIIEANTVATGLNRDPVGAAIALEQCFYVTLSANVVSGNSGAKDGGGMWLKDCDYMTVEGGSIAGHVASFGAGAMVLLNSDATISGVAISGNSGLIGGAIAAQDTSNVVVEGCHFDGNSGLIGAGVYAQGGSADIHHNLFKGNTATSSGGAVWLSGSTGRIMGNTADDNAGAGGAGGFEVSAAIDVFNNIVTNSTGAGIRCGGTTPALSYNLVWNSSAGDYSGCAAGTGSVNADPLFADAGNNDYRLTFLSPAIDAGNPGPYNDPDGSRGDMGRYGSHDFVMEQPSYPKNVAHALDNGDAIMTWSQNPEGDIDYYAIYCDSGSGFVPGPANHIASTADTTFNLGVPADTLYCRVSAVDSSGYAGGFSDEYMLVPNPATAVADAPLLANRLEQNVPNPFNPTTTIRFSTREAGLVSLVIYDVSGSRVRTLLHERRPADSYAVRWDGNNDQGQRVSTGIYFYHMRIGDFSQTRKMLLLK